MQFQFRISLSDTPVTYSTLLDGKSVTFTPVSGGKNSPDWSRVTLEDGVHIIEMKEVRGYLHFGSQTNVVTGGKWRDIHD